MPPPSPIEPASRPRLLVSVRDAEEAALACAAGADLVDAKDPDRGALGALPVASVRAIVARVGAAAATSAVAGEEASDACRAVSAMAATGAGYVKIALDNTLDDAALAALAGHAPGRLIAVLFAEDGMPAATASRLAAAGFRGAMIDTRGKDGRRLTDLLSEDALSAFVASCRGQGLLCGLAGSLRVTDIPALAALGPDYLGFRGGLCRDGDRRNALDEQRIRAAAQALAALARRDAA